MPSTHEGSAKRRSAREQLTELLARITTVILRPQQDWTAEAYGIGKALRVITGYPKDLPLPGVIAHGADGSGSELNEHEYNNPYRTYISWSRELAQARYERLHIISAPHPWPFYRRQMGYCTSTNKSGTIAFFPHSTPYIKRDSDATHRYIQELGELPPKFRPLTICLHHHDINSHEAKTLRKLGYNLACAGEPLSEEFPDNFYTILAHHKYATSPDVGSSAFYAIEAGLDFFLYGTSPDLINMGDPNYKQGKIKRSPSELDTWERIIDSCSYIHERKADKQKLLASEILNLSDFTTYPELRIELLRALIASSFWYRLNKTAAYARRFSKAISRIIRRVTIEADQ